MQKEVVANQHQPHSPAKVFWELHQGKFFIRNPVLLYEETLNQIHGEDYPEKGDDRQNDKEAECREELHEAWVR